MAAIRISMRSAIRLTLKQVAGAIIDEIAYVLIFLKIIRR
jgi:hypothetical protein